MTIMVLSVVACASIAGVCFVSYLLFLRFVIVRTGSTDGLSDVAKAIAAYRVPLPTRGPRPRIRIRRRTTAIRRPHRRLSRS